MLKDGARLIAVSTEHRADELAAELHADMPWMTSSDCSRLPGPLLSRCPPIRLRHLTIAELTGFVRREGAKRNLSETSLEAICEILTHPSLRQHYFSLRVASRMLQRAADFEQGPVLH